MSATILCSFNYPAADFTSLVGSINFEILKQEASDAGLSVDVAGAIPSGDGARVDLVGLPTSADKTALDAIVAAHTGGNFASLPISIIVEAESNDSGDSGAEIQKALLETGKLPAGNYIATWNLEVYLDADSSDSRVKGLMKLGKNGGAKAERAELNNATADPQPMGGAFPIVAVDGDSYEVELTFQRIGAAGKTAKARRARLAFVPITP